MEMHGIRIYRKRNLHQEVQKYTKQIQKGTWKWLHFVQTVYARFGEHSFVLYQFYRQLFRSTLNLHLLNSNQFYCLLGEYSLVKSFILPGYALLLLLMLLFLPVDPDHPSPFEGCDFLRFLILQAFSMMTSASLLPFFRCSLVEVERVFSTWTCRWQAHSSVLNMNFFVRLAVPEGVIASLVV